MAHVLYARHKLPFPQPAGSCTLRPLRGNSQTGILSETSQVIWEGHTIQTEYESAPSQTPVQTTVVPEVAEAKLDDSPKQDKRKTPPKDKKKGPGVKKKKKGNVAGFGNEPTKLEENSSQVKERYLWLIAQSIVK